MPISASCVRWYLRFSISFAQMAEMALERGVLIHSSCICRWVQVYGPELDKRCRAHLKRTNKSYRVDETYIRIKGSADICTEPWIPPGRPSISCSRPNAMLRQPNDSFVRCCSTQPIRSRFCRKYTGMDGASHSRRILKLRSDREHPFD